ncbi:MAG: PorT family protein [Ignavibacteria bacterium]|nr:PorT family protein [Ignavibacteria bacterium]
MASSVFAQEDVLRPSRKRQPTDKVPPAGDTVAAREQRPVRRPFLRVGVEGGINLNTASRDVTGTLATSPYMVYETGGGVSPLAGLYVELDVARSVAVGVRVLYDVKSFTARKEDVIEDCPIYDPLSGYAIGYTFAALSSEYETTLTYFTISPLVRWSPVARLFIQCGPVVQFAAGNSTTTLTESMDEGEDCRFDNGTELSTTRTESSTGPADPDVRFGIDAGVGYMIPLAPWLDLVPRLGYQWMFTPFTEQTTGLDDTSQYSTGLTTYTATEGVLRSLQASLSLWFVL